MAKNEVITRKKVVRDKTSRITDVILTTNKKRTIRFVGREKALIANRTYQIRQTYPRKLPMGVPKGTI